MDPQFFLILVLLLGLAAGVAVGWFFGSRPIAEWRARHASTEAEARETEAKSLRSLVDLEVARERAESADRQLAELSGIRGERDSLNAEVARLNEKADNFADRERLLIEARETLLKEFQLTGSKVLEGAQDAFLARAAERFGSAEKSNEARIKALLEPVGVKLDTYEKQVRELEAQRIDAFGNLAGLIEGMRVGQEQVRAEAQRLGNSLRNAPKARGRWGEQQLRNVLEQCGLAEHTDFVTEHSIETDEGRLRPDAIVRVPGNKLLVIDAKVSLNAYQEAFEAQDDAVRSAALDAHTASMRNHIQTLAHKSYQSQFEDAPDYVLMFVPGEHFIAAALEHDPNLWNYAFERRVLLASPTNLVAIARTVAQVWRQDGLAKEAREIGRMGGELYDRLAKVTEDLGKVGTHLGRAVGSYNDFARSFESRVLVSAKRLKDKHVEVGKREIEDLTLVEVAPRYGADEAMAEPLATLAIDAANDGAMQDTG